MSFLSQVAPQDTQDSDIARVKMILRIEQTRKSENFQPRKRLTDCKRMKLACDIF